MKKIILCITLAAVFFSPISVSADVYTQSPTRIVIPSIHIDLPVHTSKIIFNTWEVHLDGASFGEGTTTPGNLGNTVIFSHARIGLFSQLPSIKKGDLVYVFTRYDSFVYQVEDTFIVNPDRVDVLDNHNQYELTMYTCIGPNYSQRFIVKGKLLSNPSFLSE